MTSTFSIIVCIDKNRGIAKNGRIPWHIAEDMKFFRETTSNQIVIMGRKTWDTLAPKFRPLPNRWNIVISQSLTNLQYESKPVLAPIITLNLDEALLKCQDSSKKVFVMGGASIYTQALQHPQCEELIITELMQDYDCDVFFPEFKSNWEQNKIILEQPTFKIISYIRKNN
jgi:dihydrofolate reductase